MKRQFTDWDKIFKVAIPDKRLVSRIYKAHLQFVNKETTPFVKIGKRLKQTLDKRR